MGIIEKIYSKNVDFVENENFKGVKKIIVDNYSDEAHFVYELLQNADDVQATEITFDLRSDRLIVTHNGTLFTEENLEGICSISKGTKSDDYTKIGRFGIGFKSVFVYTDAPQVYSGRYQFEIRELVLPQQKKCEFKIGENDTVFVLPFNANKTKAIAYRRIKDKLCSLREEALLFLKSIKRINVVIDTRTILIEKEILERKEYFLNEEFEHVRITVLDSEDDSEDEDYEYDSEYEKGNMSNYYLCKKNGITLTDIDDDGNPVEVSNQSVMLAYLEIDGKVYALGDDPYFDHDQCYFVFFPTRIPSGCEFFVHAPFITKSSRDTIALNNEANDELMKNIGELIADSLIIMAEKKQLTVDFMESLFFYDVEDRFGNELIRESFDKEYARLVNGRRAIIPCDEGVCRSIQAVLFTSEDQELCKKVFNLFGDKWIGNYLGMAYAPAVSHVEKYSAYYNYMRQNFECSKFSFEEIVQKLDAAFFEEKDSEWFKRFCSLIVTKGYYGYSARYNNLDRLPLIRTKEHKHIGTADAAAIYMNNGTLDENLIDSEHIQYLYRDVFKLKDYSLELSDAKAAICRIKEDDGQDFDSHLEQIRKIIIAIDNKKISAKDIENEPIIYVVNQKIGIRHKTSPKKALIGKWERANGSFDLYVLCAGVGMELIDPRYFDAFDVSELKRLGCKSDGLGFVEGSRWDFFKKNAPAERWYEASHLRPLQGKANNRQFHALYQMEHFEEILSAPMNIEKSIAILRLAKEFDTQIKDWVEWSSRKDYDHTGMCYGYGEYYSLFGSSLRSARWMLSKQGEWTSPSAIKFEDLAPEYRKVMTADIADKLGLKTSSSEKLKTVNEQLQSDGFFAIPLSEKEAYEEFRRQQAEKEAEAELASKVDASVRGTDAESSIPEPDTRRKPSEDTTQLTPITKAVLDIVKKAKKRKKAGVTIPKEEIDEESDVDQDEYLPAPVDYSKQIEKAKQRSAAEIEKITYFEELQAKATAVPRYSFAWFKALLEMESINSGEANARSREVSISFAKVEREPGTKRTLVLRHPDRYIPQFMEDLADIPLVLHMGDQKKTVAIEVSNIKSYTLRVKMKSESAIDGIDLETVTAATIDAKSPVFLIEELRKQFEKLGFEDDYDLQENLCENIEFVFGPPGTGKTTYLAKNVLLPIMKGNADCRVLVLTPTNKSADVLVRRIMEVSPDGDFDKWLVRFGGTGDEEIERSNVFKEKTFDIRTLKRNVTVTTIARFPYDFFMPQGKRLFLNELNWDYIVIDEASMIPIANIVYPLYQQNPSKFIIAGDPFQIEPITSVDIWKDENIYTMVHLDSFVNPKTIPHDYKVELLTTQYRSIPDIGYVFSNFAYGGILQHYRGADTQRPLNVGDDLGVETLNIIKFPVSKYESIYRCKRLQHSSSYQVYSALFTYEYVCYLSKAIADNNPDSRFSIGVIAPYRAQADMIDKLLASEKLPESIDVQVGTIHGFQGDECDIIFAVFNTPPTISSSKEMFLNKRNIINVSISRAKDYLFVVMPDDSTENINNLRLVKKVESLIKRTDVWNEFGSPDLEELIFGDAQYIEDNAFSTSHQSVNVYGLPEKIYEVRTEDDAVDVQIHKAPLVSETFDDGMESVSFHGSAGPGEKLYQSSFDLDESLIPEELRKTAIDLPVKGALSGWCYLVPYTGNLEKYTDKAVKVMYIPQIRKGRYRTVSVSVVEEDRIIYILNDMYKLFEEGLSQPEGIRLQWTRDE